MDLRSILSNILYGKLNSPRSCDDGPLISEVLRDIAEKCPKITLDDLLRFDWERGSFQLSQRRWYHGSITREHAAHVLMTG